jgi:hypothetical protein
VADPVKDAERVADTEAEPDTEDVGLTEPEGDILPVLLTDAVGLPLPLEERDTLLEREAVPVAERV